MTGLRILLVLLVSFSGLVRAFKSEGHCVWYDVCGKDPNPPNTKNPHCLNCAYDGEAILLNSTYEKLLDEACPHLRGDLEGDFRLCCSPSQLQDLKSNFDMAQAFLNRCPTCFYNFRKNFCDMTCRPDQSLFLKATYVEGPRSECKQTGSKCIKFVGCA